MESKGEIIYMAQPNQYHNICKLGALYIGLQSVGILPDRPVKLAGQFFERIGLLVHDPITVTALAIEGKTNDYCSDQMILVSCDLACIEQNILNRVRTALKVLIPDFDSSKLIMNAIHTHTGPVYEVKADFRSRYLDYFPSEHVGGEITAENLMHAEEYASFLVDKISEAAAKAWQTRESGGVSWWEDAAAIGYNRRVVYDDGQAIMYGNSHTFNFKCMEGPTDPRIELLYIWNLQKQLKGVLINAACPSQVVELESFISADYWHQVRVQLRERLSQAIAVIPLCGAAGDQTPIDLVRISKDNERELLEWTEQVHAVRRNLDNEAVMRGIGERICETIVRGLKPAKKDIRTEIIFVHRVTDMRLPYQTVSERDVAEARQTIEEYKKKIDNDNKLEVKDMVLLFKSVGILDRYKQQEKDPFVSIELHIIRLGDVALATNPFELFTEYGVRIKARSKAEQTFIVQLACGNAGYLPTENAIKGGSYSGLVASISAGPEGGSQLVNETVRHINELWE
jgi:hypothetical protein